MTAAICAMLRPCGARSRRAASDSRSECGTAQEADGSVRWSLALGSAMLPDSTAPRASSSTKSGMELLSSMILFIIAGDTVCSRNASCAISVTSRLARRDSVRALTSPRMPDTPADGSLPGELALLQFDRLSDREAPASMDRSTAHPRADKRSDLAPKDRAANRRARTRSGSSLEPRCSPRGGYRASVGTEIISATNGTTLSTCGVACDSRLSTLSSFSRSESSAVNFANLRICWMIGKSALCIWWGSIEISGCNEVPFQSIARVRGRFAICQSRALQRRRRLVLRHPSHHASVVEGRPAPCAAQREALGLPHTRHGSGLCPPSDLPKRNARTGSAMPFKIWAPVLPDRTEPRSVGLWLRRVPPSWVLPAIADEPHVGRIADRTGGFRRIPEAVSLITTIPVLIPTLTDRAAGPRCPSPPRSLPALRGLHVRRRPHEQPASRNTPRDRRHDIGICGRRSARWLPGTCSGRLASLT